MEPTGLSDPIYVHLLKTAYSLADAMAMTHEIQEVFFQQKDMEFEDWAQKVRLLLAQIDREIYLHCEVPVLQIGLHSKGNLHEPFSSSDESWGEGPKQVLAAAAAFGIAFDKVTKTLDQAHQTLKGVQDTRDSLSADKMSEEKIELCKRITEQILNEFGLKGSDIARIY